MTKPSPHLPPFAEVARRDWIVVLTYIAMGLGIVYGSVIAGWLQRPVMLIMLLAGLSGVILAAAIAIVRHAEELAHRLGEPLGTLILTLAVTGLEVAMVGFVMSTGEPKPALARDTMFAVVMLVLNGFMGVALLLGGVRHREQSYNLQSANAFLGMIVPLTVLGLVLPSYTRTSPGQTLSAFQMSFLSVMSLGIYITFLFVQNWRHRGFFISAEEPIAEPEPGDGSTGTVAPTWFHVVMLLVYGVPVVLLAKQMAAPLDAAVLKLGAPPALAGMIVAILVLTPESIAAIRAALGNRLQRSVNVLLGSVLASIGLTIPLVIAIALATGRPLQLGVDAVDTLQLLLTLFVTSLTFSLPRTHMLFGCVHLLLFGAYLMLLFER